MPGRTANKPRVAVLLDWQNVYHHAREAFGLEGKSARHGTVDPLKIAKTLAAGKGRGAAGDLVRVEVHRGFPSPRRQPDANRAVVRQNNAWKKASNGLVCGIFQNLRYRTVAGKLVAEEKGVDVRLAINAVELVLQGDCETAIIFSHDSDLLPVVDVLRSLKGDDAIETASWVSRVHRKRIPPRDGDPIFNHELRESVYDGAKDLTDYSVKPS